MLRSIRLIQRVANFSRLANPHEVNPKVPDWFKSSDYIEPRFIGSEPQQVKEMLKSVEANSLDELVDKIIPKEIRSEAAFQSPDNFPDAITESAMVQHLQSLANKNKIYKNYIGQGFYGTHTPYVILRNVLEDPGWYTSYTPYQAEISQGRLEALLNYQTVITELTGMDVSNASLLDEATAAGEAMFLANSWFEKKKFFVDNHVFPQSIEHIKTKAYYLGIDIVVGDAKTYDFKDADQYCGVLVQSPDNMGEVHDWSDLFKHTLKDAKLLKIIGTDLLSLTINKTPKDQGANVAYGNSQRFGVPMGFGGPHAAFFAVEDEFKRKMPGRIIGISKDANGRSAYRMSLQTREQHIRREKATSNICTAQALLANMAGLYATYHGPQGLQKIANRVNCLARSFAKLAKSLGIVVKEGRIFDTVVLHNTENLQEYLHYNAQINVRKTGQDTIFSFDETHTLQDVEDLFNHLQHFTKKKADFMSVIQKVIPYKSERAPYMQQKVFNSLHSETEMLRYINYLRQKDISLAKSMISLGSCTMKLNPTSFMLPVSFQGFSQLHPFSPLSCTQGYQELTDNVEKWLCDITQMEAVSLMPNSGAQGEYTGLLCIRKYHIMNGQKDRNICLIPISAHGTNPASAVLAGLNVVAVNVIDGYVDLNDLNKKIKENEKSLACMMITYPSTYGVYEDQTKKIIQLIHDHGGLVYMDGANMNAQVGYTSPGYLGADVCHLNLHKTFSIPHGGGGPGLGPIAVNKKLAPYLPGREHSLGSVASSLYSSASIIPIPYSYFGQLGRQGAKKCTAMAMLNANYLMKNLKNDYKVLFTGQNGMCAHEFIIDIRPIKQESGITEEDIAKRLMDYGFHAPTMSFPVPGTLMIEPTESESKSELDRFIEAMKNIKLEIEKVKNGQYDKNDNPLKNAPHTQDQVINSGWNHKYSREEAAFPLPFVMQRGKVWPTVSRINNAFGDRNLICQCPSVSDYQQ
ncbi:unnamed protein product [Paramecium primaurelia]|uniref:Glycine cleavage system P protein n=1 Tax=Paramecium primaurelia TaxID=5886 RepID=A0A8S1LPW8_PARPR|nr:unnamed protein product [Paramecium primaurelia]